MSDIIRALSQQFDELQLEHTIHLDRQYPTLETSYLMVCFQLPNLVIYKSFAYEYINSQFWLESNMYNNDPQSQFFNIYEDNIIEHVSKRARTYKLMEISNKLCRFLCYNSTEIFIMLQYMAVPANAGRLYPLIGYAIWYLIKRGRGCDTSGHGSVSGHNSMIRYFDDIIKKWISEQNTEYRDQLITYTNLIHSHISKEIINYCSAEELTVGRIRYLLCVDKQ